MSDARSAYQAALKEIETAKTAGATELCLDDPAFHALKDIPPQVAGIKVIQYERETLYHRLCRSSGDFT